MNAISEAAEAATAAVLLFLGSLPSSDSDTSLSKAITCQCHGGNLLSESALKGKPDSKAVLNSCLH